MSVETYKFDAEVGKVLHLVIHTLYTNKKIFLRELISNASDACDKLRYLSQSNAELLQGESDFKITVSMDKEKRYIILQDNGIGMNKEDLTQNLGTIASSGTQKFLEQLGNDAKKDNMLIGQFGVGFYSSYMVADEVKVISKKAGEAQAYQWSSKGEGEYYIEDCEADFIRGTKITLHIKPEYDNYLDHFQIKDIIKTYSDHISVPIYYVGVDGKEQQVNSSSALWTRAKSDITDEQYEEFYRNIAYAIDKPWITIHNKSEGVIEFTNLLFIPSSKTFDLFHPDRKSRVKLYIKKVFITDENVALIPKYMRFLRGVVDSEDLPLNISRETLQHSPLIDKIQASITKKVITELEKQKTKDQGEYETFWNNFGAVLKEGLCEGTADVDKLLKICLFRSALQDKFISLDEYIANLKSEQKNIYYITGDDLEALKSSPQIEGLLSRNIDVLLLTDDVDKFWVMVTRKYNDYVLKSVTSANIEIDNCDTKTAESSDTNNDAKDDTSSSDDQNCEQLIKYFKEVLGDKVKSVEVSKKLTRSPVCLTVPEGSMDIRTERFLIEQKQLSSHSSKILEINPNHTIIKKINENIKLNQNLDVNKQLVMTLLDQSYLIEGQPIPDLQDYCNRINFFIEKSVN
ncbi:molecular chaperone HtpG [Orientia tsutsugamushi]|uniref:Chaperone protein HtpG n=2 Tax=Orientia tsutsugamushi TaxID=784 RepID=A0A0F3RKZ4_ORITS|nr:molecular chaperone HtpG [Orientia tsutsugamushi]KJW07060.1 histidine kinase-, DNA gyrase B-, and HSP90-like ATPase family protein [Orientia tsutsugamushi str. UT144]SPR07532.1 molecular chaperone HtpG [Orientia tsutsugamushi]